MSQTSLSCFFLALTTTACSHHSSYKPPPGSPAQPTELQAALSGDRQIKLTWRDNADNETSYEIRRASKGRSR